MNCIDKNLLLKVADGVRAREEEFGLLIVSKTTPAMSLNMDSKFVWNLIDGINTVGNIIDKVKVEYEADDVEENVYAILNGFMQLKLVHQAE
ncbi:PqqD family peptide modification chaperone [Clostridium sp. 19966]|uniref:PqqD family peptide modification chaperone n=1 Tax=Clostridium sp. 19966 TaxID=2768166 RepID=UPI0028DEA45A|nr:PqqD family peptide modification chaperone [Clostridium sp. 19966]MDT8716078.1 PqqD family peptide modification chaperone [Clostridium sp. 19966]